MKTLFTFIYLLISIICKDNITIEYKNSTNNSSDLNDTYKGFKANGYKCRERLDEYRKKFNALNTSRITDQNMTNIFKSDKTFLIYFHSACPQECTDFMPHLKFINDYVKKLNETEKNVPQLVTVDLSDDMFCIMFQQKFKNIPPPYLLLHSGEKHTYDRLSGYFNVQSAITFITKYIYSDIYDIKDEKLLNQFLSPRLTYASVIIFNNRYNAEINEISKRFSLVLFGQCDNKELCLKKLGNDNFKYSDLVLVKMSSNTISDYENNQNKKYILGEEEKPAELIPYNYTSSLNLREFISNHCLPVIHNITDFSLELMYSTFYNTIIYVRGKNESRTNEQISKLLRKYISIKSNNLKWGGILDPYNSEEDIHRTELFKIDYGQYSNGNVAIQGFVNEEPKVYKSNIHQINKDKKITEEFLDNFIKEFSKGKIKPEKKSEALPRRHPKLNLHKVVAKSFDYEITYNSKKAIILCLFGAHLKNKEDFEYMIDTLTMKLDVFNETLIFAFMNIDYNYMKNEPIFDKTKTPYYRFYYTNKSRGYDDFKGDYKSYEEIEDWIAVNYGKDKGKGYDQLIREYLKLINQQMKEELEEQQKKHDEMMKKKNEAKQKEEMKKKEMNKDKKDDIKKETDL